MNRRSCHLTSSIFWRLFFPRSLLARLFYMLILALLVADLISGLLWYEQTRQIRLDGLHASITSMIDHMFYSYNFINSIPEKYRYLIINQQQALGDSRTFISINHHLINEPTVKTSIAQYAQQIAVQQLKAQITTPAHAFAVSVVYQHQLVVFDSHTLINTLPADWNRFSHESHETKNVIFVAQIMLDPHSWLFMASQLPVPYEQIDIPFINLYQWIFMTCSLLLVLLFTYLLIRKELKPLKKLAQAAEKLSSTLDIEEIEEKGSAELVTAIQAFNQMQNRLRTYLHNREMLFTAISHDLKTPLTRLKLRVELMDNEQVSEKLQRDINDIELMIKGALQSMKQTDIHENFEQVDVVHLLKTLADAYPNMPVLGKAKPIVARPLALKRCFSNIIDNAVKYGHDVLIAVSQTKQSLTITVTNKAQNVDYDLQEKLFSPYFRLDKSVPGSGLGLTIARNIARSHGGDVILESHANQVTVRIILKR